MLERDLAGENWPAARYASSGLACWTISAAARSDLDSSVQTPKPSMSGRATLTHVYG